MNLPLIFALAAVGLLVIEAIQVARVRSRIPLRIMVTGTRGKSSLVRILAAGIRASEPHTCGKVTGDAPLILNPDGSEGPIRRRSPARLHEQRGILRRCCRQGAHCLVLESMTITPETMQAEMRLVRPTLVVLTNVRDDHRETLGPDPVAQREAYLGAIPADVPLVTGSDVPGDGGFVEDLLGLAEEVLVALGRNTPAAAAAMRVAAAELVHKPTTLSLQGRHVTLLDGFSANDPESLASLWGHWRRTLTDTSAWSVLLATRADRPLRTRQFCDWLASRDDVGKVHVAGDHAPAAARLLRARGLKVVRLGDRADSGILVGIGNAKGLGLHLRSAAEGTVG